MKAILILTILLVSSCGNTQGKKHAHSHSHGHGHSHTQEANGVADTLWVNKVESKVQWIGKKMVGKHDGHVELAGGFIARKGGVITNGEILVNMQSITVDDIEAEEWNIKLVNHLKNDDFFNSEKYPTAKFVFDSVHEEEGSTHIHGELTIRDKTQPFEMFTTLSVEEDKSTAMGTVEIDRTLFGIKYGSEKFFEDLGDKMILDNFTLNFNIVAN
jgi:polyisoprenoid-binding protein YceI